MFLPVLFGISLTLVSVQSNGVHIVVDDYLNSEFELFPEHVIHHHPSYLEDETLEMFNFLLEDDDILNKAYDNFKKKYGERQGPLHLPVHTHHQRRHLFKDNLFFIFHHNFNARLRNHSTYEMGVNKFTDMHLDEIKQERLGLIIPDDFQANLAPLSNLSKADEKALPSTFDWRSQEVISPVKDQDKCGACVMFALTSALEGVYAINTNKQIIDLSEQFMLDCAIKENGYKKNQGCDGNNYPDSLQFVKDHGLTSEHLYPYKGKQGACKFDGMHPTINLKEYKRLADNPLDVKYACVTYGPPAVGFFVYRQFMFYKSGIYDHCGHPMNSVGGHAMAVVGYNDAEKVKYYVMKNQWGQDWGEKGYIRHISTDSSCGLEKLAYSLHL